MRRLAPSVAADVRRESPNLAHRDHRWMDRCDPPGSWGSVAGAIAQVRVSEGGHATYAHVSRVAADHAAAIDPVAARAAPARVYATPVAVGSRGSLRRRVPMGK
jgi:hypothetical protein